jgi:hypothetical protein
MRQGERGDVRAGDPDGFVAHLGQQRRRTATLLEVPKSMPSPKPSRDMAASVGRSPT